MTYTDPVARQPRTKRLSSRVTDECRSLLDAMMSKWGQSEASVIERMVRETATREGIELPHEPKPEVKQ